MKGSAMASKVTVVPNSYANRESFDHTVKVVAKSSYGTTRLYPLNEQARLFAEMIGVRTLTPLHLEYIKRMGFHIIKLERMP
jgi:hypothetical protein